MSLTVFWVLRHWLKPFRELWLNFEVWSLIWKKAKNGQRIKEVIKWALQLSHGDSEDTCGRCFGNKSCLYRNISSKTIQRMLVSVFPRGRINGPECVFLPDMILGVWISTKPFFVRVSLKSWHTPDCRRKMAWLVVVFGEERGITTTLSVIHWESLLNIKPMCENKTANFCSCNFSCKGKDIHSNSARNFKAHHYKCKYWNQGGEIDCSH